MQRLTQAAWTGMDSSQRLIDIEWTGPGVHPPLWPYCIRYRDELNRPFLLNATCFCGAEGVDLKQVLGKPVAFAVDIGPGQHRWLAGIVTVAGKREGTGSFATVELQVESALSLLDRRRTCRVFQDQSVPQIVTTILDEHRQRNPAIAAAFTHTRELQRSHPVRSYCVQFNESDLAFIDRLLAEERITYYFTFDRHNSINGHQLVLTDTAPYRDQVPLTLHYRAQADAVGQPEQRLTGWTTQRHLAQSRVSLTSHDYLVAARLQGEDESAFEQSESGRQATSTLTSYQAEAPYYADHGRELGAYARLRMQAEELQASTFCGQGPLVGLRLGESILLEDHPAHAGESTQQRTFVVTSTTLWLCNNAPEAWQLPPSLLEQAGLLSNDGMDTNPASLHENVKVDFTAVHRDVTLVPRYAGTLDRPTANGPQTATVVGPSGEEVFTDALGRIRIQFHWQRPDEHPNGTAASNERASTWVRVAMPSSGTGFGHQFVPRVGQEVLVAFLHNDIDRPVVVGTLYNGQHAPPSFSGRSGLPGNRALSGIQSREHRGQGYSELLMDDTPGQVRTRLATTSFASELNLGKLSTSRADGQAQPRGEGAELRTDAALALRAAHGVLITSYARELAGGGQLDRQELLALLDDCIDLFRGLGQTASQRGAQQSDNDGMDRLQNAITAWSESSSETGAPVVAIAGHSGILSTTPQSQLHYAGANHDIVATDNVQSVSGGVTLLQAGAGVSIYAQDGGIQAIANRGQVLVQTQDADIALNAQKSLHASANEGEVLVTAPTIRLVADDGSYIRIGNGIEIGTQGDVKVHGTKHDWLGPKTDGVTIPAFGHDPAARQYRFHYEGDSDAAVPSLDYRLVLEDGQKVEGTAGADGQSVRVERGTMQKVTVEAFRQTEDAGLTQRAISHMSDSPHDSPYIQQFQLFSDLTGLPLARRSYKILRQSGDTEHGITDTDGMTHVVKATAVELLQVELDEEIPHA
ncbi:type VI secretion system Vgr family protein [Stenotrophomonas sp. SY1]|uniref:type VI secretion system Vgr family protein n=1 Tax=Stenotrophomonas sp. SY1 TaxID=477235 RepID=UPI001E593046|nr:type VI secretion system Vgr family protein [Stenotrophomonas sp. SY1]MCD9088149.1 type VI secretion system tip protein VgrG [Stenotrophomonas sp. SY1]